MTVAAPAVPFQFTDHRPAYTSSDAYDSTNEQIPRLRELTDRVSPAVCGAIASGGEVPLAVMLLQPHLKQCVAIDQSYDSLKWAHLKALVIHLYTPEEAHKLLTGSYMPPAMIKQIEQFTPANMRPTTYRAAGATLWQTYVSVADIGQIKANLDKLHLVHGDIRDLPQFSADKYDLIYLSNATDKGNYLSNKLSLEHFNDIIRRRGYILTTGAEQDQENKWTEVRKLGFLDGHVNMSWSYRLLQYERQDVRAYYRQAWERIRDIQLALPVKKLITNDYYREDIKCVSCGVKRPHDCYRSSRVAYCAYCSHTVILPMTQKIVRLYDRYPIKLAA